MWLGHGREMQKKSRNILTHYPLFTSLPFDCQGFSSFPLAPLRDCPSSILYFHQGGTTFPPLEAQFQALWQSNPQLKPPYRESWYFVSQSCSRFATSSVLGTG